MALDIQRRHDDEVVDIREKGRSTTGEIISSDRRLFMQLMSFGECNDSGPLIEALEQANISGVLYEDINDPRGVALLTFSDNPDYFIETMRGFLNLPPFSELSPNPEYTMLGRTYALGYEPDLD